MKKIKIRHQEDGKYFTFIVKNPNKLTKKEVENICNEMGVSALLVNSKYYKK